MLPIVRIINRRANRRQLIRQLQSRRRVLRHEARPFSLPERQFIQLFRVNKQLARAIIEMLRPHVNQPITRRGVPVEIKILVALRFFATGSYQRCIGEEYNFSLSQSSIHFIIKEVTQAMVIHVVPEAIRFPQNIAERNLIKAEFMDRFGFPGTIGAIGCTHVAILKPSEDEQNFLNRKGFHSINCQLICDANLKILNVFANFGGSTHDSFIWNNSSTKLYLQRLEERGQRNWLIGDSGYAQTTLVMSPFRDAMPGSPEARYNHALTRARNCIERCNGLLKGRWRCILEERVARYDPRTMCKIIKVCAALHNMCIEEGIPDDDIEIINDDDFRNDNVVVQNQDRAGLRARQNIVNRYFLV